MTSTEIVEREVKVSVIMPIYNAYDFLRPAIDSVLDQTLREIEIICIDDGSTDHSLDIIREYQKQDDRVRIVTETNAGPALARNNGLRRARGEYVAFLDADDFFERELLERLYTVAKQDDLDIAIARYDIYNSKKAVFRENVESDHGRIYEGGHVTSKNEFPDFILQSTTGAAWNKLYRRQFLLEKNITFLTEVKMFEDVYFTVVSLAFAERVGKLPEVLIHHRIYSEQSRARLFKKYYPQVPEVYLKIKEFLMKGGMYEPLARGYLNLSASRCLHIFKLLWSDAKEDFWNLLHFTFAEKLGWFDHSEDCFERAEVCEFCANIQLYTFAQYQKRCNKGIKLKLGHIKQKLKSSARWKKLRSALLRLIGKKSEHENG
ncbi:MAG: glycosyltransferase [Clostridia bacterium]|nr:glycosyltransferase [Clostridia bacterium]